jgi:hypothetical protein
LKKLLLILFSILISFNSIAEWVYIDKEKNSDTEVYVLTDSIEIEDGYVYWTYLNNYSEPRSEYNIMGLAIFRGGDCENNRYVNIESQMFQGSMGTKEIGKRLKPEQEWTKPTVGQIDEKIFNYVCDYAGLGKTKVQEESSLTYKEQLAIWEKNKEAAEEEVDLETLFEFQLPEKFNNTAIKLMMEKPASVWDLGYLQLKMKFDKYLLDTDYAARPRMTNFWINGKGGLNFSFTMPGGPYKNHEVFKDKDLDYKCEIMSQHFSFNFLEWDGSGNNEARNRTHKLLGTIFIPFGTDKQKIALGRLLLADSTLTIYDWNRPSKVNCKFNTLGEFKFYLETVLELENSRQY